VKCIGIRKIVAKIKIIQLLKQVILCLLLNFILEKQTKKLIQSASEGKLMNKHELKVNKILTLV
jgi:hypothetical protein